MLAAANYSEASEIIGGRNSSAILFPWGTRVPVFESAFFQLLQLPARTKYVVHHRSCGRMGRIVLVRFSMT